MMKYDKSLNLLDLGKSHGWLMKHKLDTVSEADCIYNIEQVILTNHFTHDHVVDGERYTKDTRD